MKPKSFILFNIILAITINGCSSASSGNNKDPYGTAKPQETQDISETKTQVYFADEKEDTVKIGTILNNVRNIKDLNERIVAIAKEFTDTPYVGHTLDLLPVETLYVNTKGVDCTTFVETVMALAMASESDNPGVEEFLKNLCSIRYRSGVINGYPSRLHYISEWAADNGKRGNFREITADCDLAQERIKTIDFMSKNRHLYPSLTNDTVFKAIKENEKALKGLKFSIIPSSQVNKAAKNFLKNGDVVAIVTDKEGLDVSHVGILRLENGIPYLTHASSKYKKVVNDTMSLQDYLRRQKSPGIRVIRLNSDIPH